MGDLLAGLNSDQRDAVECRDNCLVISTAGSGKTSVLAVKASCFLDEGLTVTAVTFTRESAIELKNRILNTAQPGCKSRLLVGTFHSVMRLMAFPNKSSTGMGKSILDHIKTPFTSDWKLINEGVQFNYLNRLLIENKSKLKPRDAISIIERWKEAKGAGDFNQEEIDIAESYRVLLDQAGLIDHQDILLKTTDAILSGELSTLQTDFMLVDEYQDVDRTQYSWIKAHGQAGVKLTCVGDDDQSIYGFRRGLGFEGMQLFSQDFRPKKILMGINYRCRHEILNLAGKVISKNVERIDKTLFANRGTGGVVRWEEFANPALEAAVVAEEAALAQEDDVDFAVIAKTNRELLEIQKAMILRGVPFRKAEGRSVFELPEVQVVLSLMRTLFNAKPNDVDHVLAWAGMSVSDCAEVRRLFGNLIVAGGSADFENSTITKSGKDIWRFFSKNHREWTRLLKNNSISMLMAGINEWLLETIQTGYFESNVNIGVDLCKPSQNRTLEEQLKYIKQLSDSASHSVSHDENANKKEWRAVLMTGHGSKGLEFDRVWIIGVEHGLMPSDKSPLEEERRLFFVMITRAKNSLTFSTSTVNKPSQFLYDMQLVSKLA